MSDGQSTGDQSTSASAQTPVAVQYHQQQVQPQTQTQTTPYFSAALIAQLQQQQQLQQLQQQQQYVQPQSYPYSGAYADPQQVCIVHVTGKYYFVSQGHNLERIGFRILFTLKSLILI